MEEYHLIILTIQFIGASIQANELIYNLQFISTFIWLLCLVLMNLVINYKIGE